MTPYSSSHSPDPATDEELDLAELLADPDDRPAWGADPDDYDWEAR